jgi:endo-1,4-beta-xylanase
LRFDNWPAPAENRERFLSYLSPREDLAMPAFRRRCLSIFVVLSVLSPKLILAQAPDARPGKEPEHPAALPLWPNGEPGFEKLRDEREVVVENGRGSSSWIAVSNVHNPTITPYLPTADRATGCAVVIAPGGGHRLLAISHEGYSVGEWLAERGVAAFVLKYRLERGTTGAEYKISEHSLADIQRAIRTARSRASEWNINPAAIGVMGFSAGGEMAALASMKYDDGKPGAAEPIDLIGSKPAFQALIYPGRSNTIQPDKNSPPAFLACAYDDRPDISAGLAEVYLRFHEADVPAELHIFTSGGHGFGIRSHSSPEPVHEWPARFVEWLAERGFTAGGRGSSN